MPVGECREAAPRPALSKAALRDIRVAAFFCDGPDAVEFFHSSARHSDGSPGLRIRKDRAMNAKETLLARVADRSAVIGIVAGLCRLPLMRRFVEEGFRVIGFDVDIDPRCHASTAARARSGTFPRAASPAAVKRGFVAAVRIQPRRGGDVVIILRTYPADQHRRPDLSHVRASIRSILPHLPRRTSGSAWRARATRAPRRKKFLR